VLAIGGVRRLERYRRIVQEQLHVLKQRALVALERQHVVAALIDHLLGNVALAVEGIGGDHHPLKAEHPQQLRHRGDLVRLVGDGHLAEHQALLHRPG
jgi:hypothetical protein